MSNLKSLLNPPMNRRTNECKCDLCEAHRQVRGIIRRGDKKEMRQCIRDLSECLCNNGEELSMANAYIAELRKEAAATPETPTQVATELGASMHRERYSL